jgi:hypothetical protein
LLYYTRKKSSFSPVFSHFVKNEAGQAELVSPKHGKSFGTASLIYLLFILSTNPVSSFADLSTRTGFKQDENAVSASVVFTPAGAGPLVVAMLSTLDSHC